MGGSVRWSPGWIVASTPWNPGLEGLESRFAGLEHQFGELRERMAHLEGLLEGLREAITGRAAAG